MYRGFGFPNKLPPTGAGSVPQRPGRVGTEVHTPQLRVQGSSGTVTEPVSAEGQACARTGFQRHPEEASPAHVPPHCNQHPGPADIRDR